MIGIGLALLAGTANAGLIDFAAMANGPTGESAWDTFTFADPEGFNLSITGKNGGPAYAYLDRNTGGMGVCKSLNSLGDTKKNQSTGSGNNLCLQSNDDNITVGEMLTLVFDKAVTINTLWFNNFHDGDKSLLGDRIDIGNLTYTFTNGNNTTPSFTTSPYVVAAGVAFNIAYNNEEFYLHKMDVTINSTNVPVPATLALFGLGLAGLGWSKRKQKSLGKPAVAG